MTPYERTLLAHGRFVRALARSLARDDALADDVIQDTWLAALRKPPEASARPWLAQIVRNALRKNWRSSARRREREKIVAGRDETASEVERIAEAEELVRRVGGAVDMLSEDLRQTVFLRYYENLAPKEIATRLDVPVKTVRSRLSRAHSRLRERLDDRYGDRRAWSTLLVALTKNSSAIAGANAALLTAGGVVMGVKAWTAISGVALVAVGLVLWDGERTPLSPASPGQVSVRGEIALDAGSTVERSEANPLAAETRAIAGVPATEHSVRGRVVDPDGEPIEAAHVWIVAEENPFENADPEKTVGLNHWMGLQFVTDADGNYAADFSGPRRVLVWVQTTAGVVYESDTDRWVDTPATDVDFVANRRATATIIVSAIDQASREPLENFQIRMEGEGIGYRTARVEGESMTYELPVGTAGGIDFELELIAPEPSEPVMQTVHLDPHETREVVLGVRWKGHVAGRVVNTDGEPIEGALVFFGTTMDGRGDEPFKPFVEKRVSGARTDKDGRFDLAGDGEQVTAWHSEHSEATVSIDESSRIELGARGSIRGQWVDASGKAVVGLTVTLDRVRETTTDETGRFHFEHVEAGVRGLMLDRGYIGVRVRPGETADVDCLQALSSVRIELASGGKTFDDRFGGLMIGEAQVFTLAEFEARDGAIELTGVFPGRYLLLSRTGALATVSIDGSTASVEMGEATLAVEAEPGLRMFLTPADSGDFERLIGARIPRSVPDDGELIFGPLLPGDYWLGVGDRGDGRRVTVAAGSSRMLWD